MAAFWSRLRVPLQAAQERLRRAHAWLDDPRAELSVYVFLILLAPLIRLGVRQILYWLTGSADLD